MPHPLDGCTLRIKRADRYIKECKTLIDGFATECEDRILAAYQPDGSYLPIWFPEIPEDLPLAISDAINNLRSVFDYLVYELGINDSGVIQEGTQFPIETVKSGRSASGNPIGFDAVADRYLRGINASNRAMIEKLQPYNGATWAKTLKDISNPDKHRRLTGMSKDGPLSVWVRSARPDRRGKLLPTGDVVQVDPQHAISIVLPDGNIPVVTPLYTILAAAVDTINLFKPQFKL
jgi:hypothetical protein